ncbi:hypothetical protein [Streptomyces hundungensis]|uniref:hypothetical protein n=1 Tax=Streptomyces hundungensis TaxID=1077946 RepID=UPI003400ECE6
MAALVTARLPALPVLHEQLAGPPQQECWQRSEGFDAARHLHVLDSGRDTHRAAELLINQPVWEDRPRWGLWLAQTEREDEFLLGYRVHHAAQDGAAVAHTIQQLFDARTPLALPATACPTAGRGAVWAPAPPASGSRMLATADVPMEMMRAVSQATGASLNDVYLAALAGALRRWLPPTHRQRPAPVRVPFSLRSRADRQDRGNLFGYKRVLLPLEESTPHARLARLCEQTRTWPRERNRRLLELLPDTMIQSHVRGLVSAQDALATVTLLGAPAPMSVDGSPVTGGFALPPLIDGHLFSSVLFLYGMRATVSFTAHTRHEGVRDLPALWKAQLEELTASCGS